MRAEEVQKLIDDGKLTGPLAGVRCSNQTNMCTQGMFTTQFEDLMGNFRPIRSGRSSQESGRSRSCDSSKTNMDEFAMEFYINW